MLVLVEEGEKKHKCKEWMKDGKSHRCVKCGAIWKQVESLLCPLCENNRSNEGQGLHVNFRSHYLPDYKKKWICGPCVTKLEQANFVFLASDEGMEHEKFMNKLVRREF